jgi:hypothetical protein
MRYLLGMALLVSCLFSQISLVPTVTTINGDTVYYYSEEQMDSLIVKLSTFKKIQEEVGLLNKLIQTKDSGIEYRDSLLVNNREYIELTRQQMEDYRVLLKGKRRFWDRPITGFIVGVVMMYYAIDLSTNLK